MPAVDVAMERSLRRGLLDVLVASLRPAVERRDLAGQISDVKTAFSSWDNCMQVTYCKWPVIALIIVGGLIIFSVVWCIIRCACCGLSCCCSCFSCLKCCGDCCGCCDPPRGSRRKYLDEPYIPPHHGAGYKSQEPMHAGFGPTATPKAPDFPQYAEFDMGGKKNEDALPQMPSWEGAERKKVLVEEEEAVEMNALKKPEAGAQAAGAAMGGAAAAAVAPTGPRSPVNRSPYGPPGTGPQSNGYFAPPGADNDPYAQGAPSYNQPGRAYGEAEPAYGMAGAAMGPGRRSPHAYNNGSYTNGYNDTGYGQGGQDHYDTYGAAGQQPYDNYDNYNSQNNTQGYGIPRHQTPVHEMDAGSPHPSNSRRTPGPYGPESRRSPAPQGQYGAAYGPDSHRSPAPQGYNPDPRRSPAPQGQYNINNNNAPYGSDSRRTPGPQDDFNSRRTPGPQGGYNSRRTPAPQGDYDSRRSPAPQTDYNTGSSGYNSQGYGDNQGYGGATNAPVPLRNDGGFDFTSGYSRPPAATTASPGGYRQGSPAPALAAEQQGGAYPGYKPYQQRM
ncbi:hypothetical protein VTI74DRAFT_4880 [Chaetomium olivicolor]